MTTIDFNSLMNEAGEGFQPVPAGPYTVRVEKTEPTSSSTNKPMIRATLRIVGGPHDGRMLFDQYTISAGSPKALGFFFDNMAALGLPREFFSSNPPLPQVAQALVGRMANVQVGMKVYQGIDRNEVKNYRPAQGGVPVGAGPMPIAPGGMPGVPMPGQMPQAPQVQQQMPMQQAPAPQPMQQMPPQQPQYAPQPQPQQMPPQQQQYTPQPPPAPEYQQPQPQYAPAPEQQYVPPAQMPDQLPLTQYEQELGVQLPQQPQAFPQAPVQQAPAEQPMWQPSPGPDGVQPQQPVPPPAGVMPPMPQVPGRSI